MASYRFLHEEPFKRSFANEYTVAECFVCKKPFEEDDVLIIHPNGAFTCEAHADADKRLLGDYFNPKELGAFNCTDLVHIDSIDPTIVEKYGLKAGRVMPFSGCFIHS